jgi:hypothetical protein
VAVETTVPKTQTTGEAEEVIVPGIMTSGLESVAAVAAGTARPVKTR